MEHLGKEPSNFTKERNETFKFEQKPLEIDGFNKAKEEKFNKKIEKRKKSRREIAEKNKLLKRKKKLDEEKVEEKELWGKLNELNKEFQTIITLKKTKKKCLTHY